MVPCQFFRRRCESLKMQRDVLRDRCAACTCTRHAMPRTPRLELTLSLAPRRLRDLHAKNVDLAHRLRGQAGNRQHSGSVGPHDGDLPISRSESVRRILKREDTMHRQQENLLEMLAGVYGVSPADFETEVKQSGLCKLVLSPRSSRRSLTSPHFPMFVESGKHHPWHRCRARGVVGGTRAPLRPCHRAVQPPRQLLFHDVSPAGHVHLCKMLTLVVHRYLKSQRFSLRARRSGRDFISQVRSVCPCVCVVVAQ